MSVCTTLTLFTNNAAIASPYDASLLSTLTTSRSCSPSRFVDSKSLSRTSTRALELTKLDINLKLERLIFTHPCLTTHAVRALLDLSRFLRRVEHVVPPPSATVITPHGVTHPAHRVQSSERMCALHPPTMIQPSPRLGHDIRVARVLACSLLSAFTSCLSRTLTTPQYSLLQAPASSLAHVSMLTTLSARLT